MVEWKKLGEVCSEVIVPMRDRPKVFDGTIPWCRIEDIEGMYFHKSLSDLKVSESVVRAMNLKVYPTGTVICSCSATLGVCAINSQPLITNQTFIGLVCSELILNRFLYYYMTTRKKELKSLSTTGTIPYVSREKFENMLIPLPSLSEQERIVGILDTFTSSIENLKAQISLRRKQYEHYRDKLLDLEGKEGVEMKTLGEIFPYIRNGFVGTVTPFFTNKDNGVRYLEGTNIHNGTISDNIELYVTFDFHRKHIKNELKADDILMVQSGHIGECAVVGDKYKGSNCHALIIMSNGGNSNSKYFVNYFHTRKGFKSLAPAITGGTIKHVLAKKIDKVIIPLPSLEEQSRIVSILDEFEASIKNLEAQLQARQKQYEYYRNKLLTFE